MKNLSKISAFIFVLTLTFAACQKSTQGPKGDTGAAGANGTNGFVNISVNVYTVTSASWTNYTWPYNYDEAIISIPAITSTIVSGGDVRAYILDPTGTQWIGMPYSFLSSQYNYKIKDGQLTIQYTLYNNAAPTNPGTQQFKVVIIPPAFIKQNPNVDWNNYEAVKEKFDLE